MAYQVSDINKYTQYWKDKFPNTYGDKTDEQIIELVRVRYPEQNLPTYQEALKSSEERDVGPQLESDYPDGSLGNSKTNSEDIEPLFLNLGEKAYQQQMHLPAQKKKDCNLR